MVGGRVGPGAGPIARKSWPLVRPLVVGVYPLLEDETCFFLAVDFDKSGWQEDAAAFVRACRRLHLPAALERSRSGQGGHVWLFFESVLPAAMARRLGSHLLTEAMEGRPDIGLDSYDRLFPSQDTMPGVGSAISLPRRCRRGHASWATACSWMTTSCPGWTSGRISRAWARWAMPRLKRSFAMPSNWAHPGRASAAAGRWGYEQYLACCGRVAKAARSAFGLVARYCSRLAAEHLTSVARLSVLFAPVETYAPSHGQREGALRWSLCRFSRTCRRRL